MDDVRILDRLEHMLDAIMAIEAFVKGKNFVSFRSDHMVKDAVERNIERLSDASRHGHEALKNSHPNIDWRGIADMGNVLRHAYPMVNDKEILEAVTLGPPPRRFAVAVMARIAREGMDQP